MSVQDGLVTPSLPKQIGLMTNEQMLLGLPVTPITRMRSFSSGEFEDFISEWIYGYLKEKYKGGVWRCGGAGDKGRDVVAFIDEHSSQARWHNYQCKHYDKPLTPSVFWIELGKLCYFTFNKDYTIPERYFIVASQGLGQSLSDYILDPDKFRSGLLNNWDDKCSKKIEQGTIISLTPEFKEYINKFDFSIIKHIPPLQIIDEHRTTKWHALRFGGGLTKPRPVPPMPEDDISQIERPYINHLFEAYTDHLKTPIQSMEDITGYQRLVNHFNRQRQWFYSAEALKEFERDTLPDNTAFESLKDEIYNGVIDICESKHEDGLACVIATTMEAQRIQLRCNRLIGVLRVEDCKGICHHLVNDDRLKWVK